eukprot:scaffold55707_cov19-Tisochrysis_lutea.AAC.3
MSRCSQDRFAHSSWQLASNCTAHPLLTFVPMPSPQGTDVLMEVFTAVEQSYKDTTQMFHEHLLMSNLVCFRAVAVAGGHGCSDGGVHSRGASLEGTDTLVEVFTAVEQHFKGTTQMNHEQRHVFPCQCSH